LRASAVALCAAVVACSGTPPPEPSTARPTISPDGTPAPSNLRFVSPPSRPRLALLARDGDPAPALVAMVATDLGSAPTVALAAVVEARLLAAGLPVDTRADRNAFRVRLLGGAAQLSPKAFFAALQQAFRASIGPGTPEVAKASERLLALRRNPLPAPEAVPAADCAERLGVAPRQKVLDPLTPEGLAELESARARALTSARTALAVVGPAALCADAEKALNDTDGWPAGSAPVDPWPTADTTGAFVENDVAKGRARITVAARIAEPLAAAAAAERLGDPRGALRARLSALPLPFHVTEVLGVAHPRGGCVSITAEADDAARDAPVPASALAAAVTRSEIAAEIRTPADAATATRAIVAAADPREAAARAAWWTLSGAAQGQPDRWSTLLALAPDDHGELPAAARRFETDLTASVRASAATVVERRPAIEKGQGEVWVLLASPCGTAEEGPYDAGTSALAALAVTDHERRFTDVTIEPWITPEGVGVLAHAAPLAAPSLAAQSLSSLHAAQPNAAPNAASPPPTTGASPTAASPGGAPRNATPSNAASSNASNGASNASNAASSNASNGASNAASANGASPNAAPANGASPNAASSNPASPHGSAPLLVQEDSVALARRVAAAAARAFGGEVPQREAISDARALALSQIEKTAGPHGAALDGLLGALASDHPTQLYPLGPFARLAALGAPSVVARWQSLASGPLRMAILANDGAAQANEAFGIADHWLAPRPSPHACPATTDAALRPGRYEVDLPAGAELSQALLAVAVAARGQPGRDIAELAAHVLGGERGAVQAALDHTPIPAVASARLLGGARTAALVIDIRAPAAALDDAVTEVKSLLAHLAQDGPTEQALDLARTKKQRAEQDAAFDPRSRLVKLWLAEPTPPASAPTRAALQSFFATAFRESALVLVEAKRK
jgi:hypothetical protein